MPKRGSVINEVFLKNHKEIKDIAPRASVTAQT